MNRRRHKLDVPEARWYPDGRLEVRVPCKVPNLANSRRHWYGLARDKADAQDKVRAALDKVRAERRPPVDAAVQVTMIRVSWAKMRDVGAGGNLGTSLKYIRDTVARWLRGVPETVPKLKDGQPVLDKKGRPKLTRPPAPDAEGAGLTWRAGQVLGKRGSEGVILLIDPRPEG